MVRSLATLGALASALAVGLARADLVYFARGGQAQVPATIEGDRVELDTPTGPKIFDRSDFVAIVPGDDPVRQWPERRARAIRDGGAETLFAASWWALENGLTPEAVALLREGRIKAEAIGHGPSLKALGMLDRLGDPCPDRPDLASIVARLRPSRFAEVRGDHVILFYQADEAEARRRLELLERVVTTFSLGFAAQGVALSPPGQKLVSVWFADRRDYAGFLQRSEAAPFLDTQGFYHPILRAVFAFDPRSGETQAAGRRAIANRSRDGAPASEVDRMTLLLDLEWRSIDLGIAAHETVHQLTAATGLASRPEAFPPWLHEGLAAQFEVVRGGRWAGVGRVNDLRMPDWRSIRPASRLAPLLVDDGFARGYRRDSYAEAWGLVYFLRKSRPREFLTFLDRLRNPGLESMPPHERALLAFRDAFGGDIPALEREWRHFLGELETPLESGRPRPTAIEASSSRASR